MKNIIFYQINDKFKNVFNRDSLKVFLDIQKRSLECDNVKRQFDMFVENISLDSVNTLIEERFSDKEEFAKIENNCYRIKNLITQDEETIVVSNNFISLNYSGKHSLFLDFISLYFPTMVAINVNTNDIVSLDNLSNLSLI